MTFQVAALLGASAIEVIAVVSGHDRCDPTRRSGWWAEGSNLFRLQGSL